MLSLITVIAVTPNSWDYFRFKIGNYNMDEEIAGVKGSIRLFSASIAGFYDSGGIIAGLNMFPAENLVKRRIFQDIRYNQNNGILLVIDRDKSDVKKIIFADPVHAIVIVEEDWFFAYQDYNTRRPLSDKKTNFITVRYFLKKMWSRWIVLEYEVYGRDDAISPVPMEKVIKW